METKTLPAGTTQAQWDQYTIDLARHRENMRLKKIHFEQAVFAIENMVSKELLFKIKSRLQSELSMSDSCNEPNKPGYYRANND